MDILIVTPVLGDVPTGNVTAAAAWAGQLRALGHGARIASAYAGEDVALLLALNAEKSHPSIVAFHSAHPDHPLVVAATGTDIYPHPAHAALESLALADRIVVLQAGARDRIPPEFHDKTWIIVQSAESAHPNEAAIATFDVCVVGHLRDAKDPMLAAAASRLLPATSKARIRQAGAILDDHYAGRVEREQSGNARYAWLGSLAPSQARQLIADSHLLVLSSPHEGGGRVIGEAVMSGTPVLAARNDASVSLLGADYAGLFDAGDAQQLADLIARAESDHEFMTTLRDSLSHAAGQFDPRLEREAWRRLLADLNGAAGSTHG